MALDSIELQRLVDAVDTSYRDLEPFRSHSLDAIKQYCGRHYGRNHEDTARVPVNFIQFAVSTYVQKIAANIPKWNVRTDIISLAETAERLGLALNHVAKEIDAQSVLKGAVQNAMFNIGIVNIGTEDVDRGMVNDATQPFVELINLSDFVFDTNAKSLNFCQFMGHKFRMDREVFEECGLYKNTEQVNSTDDHGEYSGTEYRPSDMVREREWDTYREQVELWRFFLPYENIVITIPTDGSTTVCREQEWTGGEKGPYRFLCFNDVPDNIMPVAPTALWMDLHEMGNELFRKIRDQAERQKTITSFQAQAKDDMKRIRDASDGDTVLTTNPDGVREHSFGGADPTTVATFLATKDTFNYMAGNIESIAGLGAQSETASQDAMIGQAAGSRVEDMHQTYLKFAQEVGEAIADELWNDPLIEIPVVKRIPNFGIRIPAKFSADTLEGDFLDYNFDVEPYSTVHQTPQQRLNSLLMLLERMIAPMLPMFQQQGGQINMQSLVAIASQYSGLEELESVLTFGDLDMQQANEPIMPGQQSSTREYIHRSVSTGGTRAARDNATAQALLGQNVQPSQAGALMRPGA